MKEYSWGDDMENILENAEKFLSDENLSGQLIFLVRDKENEFGYRLYLIEIKEDAKEELRKQLLSQVTKKKKIELEEYVPEENDPYKRYFIDEKKVKNAKLFRDAKIQKLEKLDNNMLIRIKFIALKFSNSNEETLYSFIKYSKNNIFTKERKFAFFIKENVLSMSREDILVLIARFDCLLLYSTILIIKRGVFEKIFSVYEDYKKAADYVFSEIDKHRDYDIENYQTIKDSCYSDSRKLRILSSAQKKGIENKIPLSKLKQVDKAYNLKLKIDEKNKVVAFPDAWTFLHILNDDCVKGAITADRYIAFRKKKVNER